MNFLKNERAALEKLLPGLDAALLRLSLMDMERPGNPSIPIFKTLGGPGLLVPTALGGRGASPLEAARAQRAIASRAPSLAVATTMHHFTIATLLEMNLDEPGVEAEALAMVANANLYVASGFAEGKTGASILAPTMRIEKTANGYLLNGSKKPCSLSASMDLFTASVPAPDGIETGICVIVVPAEAPGVERKPFWQSPILGGAESDEVILHNVEISKEDLVSMGAPGRAHSVQDRGFLWFEVLISAAYIGIASGLAERALLSGKGDTTERVRLAAELEGAMAAVEGIARAMGEGERGNDALARIIMTRYAVQGALERATALAVEILGGIAFIQSFEISYLLAASRGLSLHPPPRLTAGKALDAYLRGSLLVFE
jgi:alkylation response protein AidB-like acyl-CoA dehydrogenase